MNVSEDHQAKVETAREIADEVLAAWRERQEQGALVGAMRANAKVEQLVHFLVTAFPAGATAGEAQKVAVEEGDKLSRRYLETLRPTAVPLAIMRELLAERRLTFDVHAVPSWGVFAQRYRDAILAIDTGRTSDASGPSMPNAASESRMA